MPKTSPELKEQLLKEGRWGEFIRYREELKEGGMVGIEAQQKALDKFFDNPPEAARYRKTRAKPNTKAKPKGSRGYTVNEHPSETKVKGHVGDLPKLPVVKAEDFEEKRASEVEVIRWVASNMEIADPQPKDCPSAAAWGLLVQCRKSGIAQSDFWKQTFPKLLPSRTQMEEDRSDLPDEGRAKEVIEDLLRFGREAKEEPKEEEVVEKEEKDEESELVVPEWKKGEF